MWRACRNILPMNYCLKSRKVITEDKCLMCGKSESSRHILWDCNFVAEVWRESSLTLPNPNNLQRVFIDVVWKLREDQRVDWEIFATTTWCLWKNRNLFKHEGRCKQTKTIAREAEILVKEFRQKQGKLKSWLRSSVNISPPPFEPKNTPR